MDKSKFDESVGLTLLARVRSSEQPIIYQNYFKEKAH